ncbi:scarecrow-like protein 30 [Silene latifolia]|uniref:scarecrow-like protein 30 n=1 Tax=Silene latifolia TaxID=37657 RepID=UPI003D76EE05
MYSYFDPSQEQRNGVLQNESFQNNGFDQNPIIINDPNFCWYETSNPNEDSSQIPDFPDACLKFINDILMEEDILDDRPATLQEYHALKATEKSLYDALGGTSILENSDVVESSWVSDQSRCNDGSQTTGSSNCGFDQLRDLADSPVSTLFADESRYSGESELLRGLVSGSRGRKNHERENMGDLEERSSKQIASSNEEYDEMEKFDDILICKEGKDDISPCTRKTAGGEVEGGSVNETEIAKGSKSRRKAKRKSKKGEVVDLRNLLIQCAQAVTSFEIVNANELLKQIRQHASEFGDSVQRVAYYFANGLEARLAGTGSDLYRDFVGKPISSAEILKGYQVYVSAVPFQRTSYFLANQTIAKLAATATKIHIIDFGIFFGFQWPCLIQLLSRRQVGAPRLRITGVDFPQSGLKPAKKIEETGSRLAGYCERFGVPFEFQAVAQRWHTLKSTDFKIEKDELVVVSCLYQSRKLPDESVEIDSPRDRFLKLIKSLNPDLFIHGVVNGTFNAPFFITRFREALYHYSALFDVFEATMPREDQERLLIERYLYGKDVMNIVACEGSERIERPESYKQWQMRHLRVGFTQVGLDQEVVSRARAMVKANYHKDIMVDQDRHWMVQGWKGRILSAVSCWKPA